MKKWKKNFFLYHVRIFRSLFSSNSCSHGVSPLWTTCDKQSNRQRRRRLVTQIAEWIIFLFLFHSQSLSFYYTFSQAHYNNKYIFFVETPSFFCCCCQCHCCWLLLRCFVQLWLWLCHFEVFRHQQALNRCGFLALQKFDKWEIPKTERRERLTND